MSLSRIDSNAIAANAISTSDLADGSITTAKLAANTVISVANGGTGNITATFVNLAANVYNTLPVASGGTGATTLTVENVIIGNGTGAVKFVAPGTDGNVLTSNGNAWISEAIVSGGNYIMQVFTTPGTYTKPAGLKAIKITVVAGGGSSGGTIPGPHELGTQGGGGAGGAAIEYIDASALPGPQPYTVGTAGSSSSFGSPAFLSATGGSNGDVALGGGTLAASGGAGGTGSGGQLNITGGGGGGGTVTHMPTAPYKSSPGATGGSGGVGGNSIFGGGGQAGGSFHPGNGFNVSGGAGSNYGGGGGGGARAVGSLNNTAVPPTSGAAGVIVVEEFY